MQISIRKPTIPIFNHAFLVSPLGLFCVSIFCPVFIEDFSSTGFVLLRASIEVSIVQYLVMDAFLLFDNARTDLKQLQYDELGNLLNKNANILFKYVEIIMIILNEYANENVVNKNATTLNVLHDAIENRNVEEELTELPLEAIVISNFSQCTFMGARSPWANT